MQGNHEKLRRELQRLRRPRSALITPAPGQPPVEVRVGDTVEIVYEGQNRRVRILAITSWGIRAWDEDKQAARSFRFTKIGFAGDGMPAGHETDTAASG